VRVVLRSAIRAQPGAIPTSDATIRIVYDDAVAGSFGISPGRAVPGADGILAVIAGHGDVVNVDLRKLSPLEDTNFADSHSDG
jgi:hypothetical protein